MGKEGQREKPVVLGRSVVAKDSAPFTIGDKISQIRTWIENCQSESQQVGLQGRIDKLSEAADTLGVDSSYMDYVSSQKD